MSLDAVKQAYYTSVQEGLTGHAGFQFTSISDGFEPTILSGVEGLLGYKAPRGLPPSPSPSQIADFPIIKTFERLEGGDYIFIRTRYLGTDYSGRFGNYFAHVVLIEADSAPLGLKPFDLFDLGWWRDSGGVGAPFPIVEFPAETGEVSLPDMVQHGPQPEVLASALRLILDGTHTLYIEDEPGSTKEWLDLCYATMPRDTWWDLTFTTSATATNRSPSRVKFVDPQEGLQLQPYELRSTATLISATRESAGPSNAFGRVVGGLLGDGDEGSLESLVRRIADSGLPRSGEVLDGVAIASSGDPELHQLGEDDALLAIRVVLEANEGLFTIRHVGWAFDQLSPAKAEEVDNLFAKAQQREGELAREIAREAFEWLLRERDLDSIAPLSGGRTPGEDWTEIWFGVLASVDTNEYSRVLANGLRMNLAATDIAAGRLGREIASKVTGAECPVEMLLASNDLPSGTLTGLVEFSLERESDPTIDLTLFRHPAIASEAHRQLSTSRNLEEALRLWNLSETLRIDLDEDDLNRLISLVGSRKEADGLLAALGGSGVSIDAKAALIGMCAHHGVRPGSELMSEFEIDLDRGEGPSEAELVDLYSRLKQVGVRTDLGDAILFLGWEPRSDKEVPPIIDDSLRILGRPLSQTWRRKVIDHASRLVAYTEDPRVHLELIRKICSDPSGEVELGYIEEMKKRLGRRREAGRAGALIFLTWPRSGSESLGSRKRDEALMSLSEKQRQKVEARLPRRQAAEWSEWCESNPPRGWVGRRRARR